MLLIMNIRTEQFSYHAARNGFCHGGSRLMNYLKQFQVRILAFFHQFQILLEFRLTNIMFTKDHQRNLVIHTHILEQQAGKENGLIWISALKIPAEEIIILPMFLWVVRDGEIFIKVPTFWQTQWIVLF